MTLKLGMEEIGAWGEGSTSKYIQNPISSYHLHCCTLGSNHHHTTPGLSQLLTNDLLASNHVLSSVQSSPTSSWSRPVKTFLRSCRSSAQHPMVAPRAPMAKAEVLAMAFKVQHELALTTLAPLLAHPAPVPWCLCCSLTVPVMVPPPGLCSAVSSACKALPPEICFSEALSCFESLFSMRPTYPLVSQPDSLLPDSDTSSPSVIHRTYQFLTCSIIYLFYLFIYLFYCLVLMLKSNFSSASLIAVCTSDSQAST